MNARRLVLENSLGTIADAALVEALIQKWEPLLEGIPRRTEHQRHTLGATAMIMENQARYLHNMNEETRTSNVGPFSKFIFPLLYKVFPNLIAHELLSVQPMTAPYGYGWLLDFVAGISKGSTQKGDVFPYSATTRHNPYYTSDYINGELLAVGNGTAYGGGGAALSSNLIFAPVLKPSRQTQAPVSVTLKEISAVDGTVVQTAAFLDTGAFDPSSDATAGTLNYSNGAITAFKFTAAVGNGNNIIAYYRYDNELNSSIATMQMDIKRFSLEARTRKIKAMWSSEAADDLRALHGEEAERLLVNGASREMALEIDRELIGDLFANSAGTVGIFDRIPPSGIEELSHLRSVITVLSKVSGAIHKKTGRARANFIVTSTEVQAILEQFQTHNDLRAINQAPDASAGDPIEPMQSDNSHGQFGIFRAGPLQGKWNTYIDPEFPSNFALVGLRGGNYLECGAVWAPYTVATLTPTFVDPNDNSYRKGLQTRYAKAVLRPEYYGQVRFLNL